MLWFVFLECNVLQRAQYDLEEVMRNDLKKQSGSSTYRTHADAPNYPFERSSRRQWKEGWRPYGSCCCSCKFLDWRSSCLSL
ncbi:hypothetical protein OIU79_027748 [Salix purpurea]|uniref:Uncharacterized protein n=1 Tax=Salix purpurea TaxID=77065 RepID=A0A9Q1A1U9_SALPP|nr:hypothetical protein OIU79_027748 [Salix purpurea]